MADLLALSTEIIDNGLTDRPFNRTSNELSEVADGLAIVESFSHSVVVDTGAADVTRVRVKSPGQVRVIELDA